MEVFGVHFLESQAWPSVLRTALYALYVLPTVFWTHDGREKRPQAQMSLVARARAIWYLHRTETDACSTAVAKASYTGRSPG